MLQLQRKNQNQAVSQFHMCLKYENREVSQLHLCSGQVSILVAGFVALFLGCSVKDAAASLRPRLGEKERCSSAAPACVAFIGGGLVAEAGEGS